MKKIKFIIFLLIVLFGKNVFAQNVTSSVRCSYNDTGSTYYGDPNDGFNSARCYDIGTRYSPRLGYIEFYLPTSVMSFSADKSYTVTMNMATNDWRNNIILQNVRYVNSSGSVITSTSSLPSMSNFRFISRKQIKFDFKLPTGTIYPYLRFTLSSSTYGNPNPDISSSTFMTGDSNWNLSSIDISPVSSSSGSSSGSYDDSGIINNNNQNTSDVISNNNQNTQEVIDNQNSNTDKINDTINSGLNNVCPNILELKNLGTCKFVNNGDTLMSCGTNIIDTNTYNGSVNFSYSTGQWRGFNTNDYYKVKPSTLYYLGLTSNITNDIIYAKVNYYNSKKQFISQNTLNFSGSKGSASWSTPSNASYVRFSFETTTANNNILFSNIYYSTSNSYCSFGSSTSKIDATNQAINDVNSSLTDETAPEIDLDLDLDTSSPVSDLLTMPITLLNKVFDTSDDTCQPYVLPFDFFGGNNTLTFPCIDLRQYLGNSVYNILDTILCFFFCYEIGMMCVSIYEDITSLRDGFDSLYTPRHAKPLGKHTKEVE